MSLDGLGFAWLPFLATAASTAGNVATIVATDKALDLDGPKVRGAGTAAEQAAEIYRAEQARASFPGVLLTPASMIGLGAVAVALIASRR